MSYLNLKEAVESALATIGAEQTLEAVPELASLDSWNIRSLAAVLCDKNNITFKEQALLSLLSQLHNSPNSLLEDHEQKSLEDYVSKAELPHMSRDFSSGVLVSQFPSSAIDYLAVDGPSIEDSSIDPPREFFPFVGISIGHQSGPLKTTLDSIFLSGLHRSRSRNEVCTAFFRHILHLWKLILHSWFNSPQKVNVYSNGNVMVLISRANQRYTDGSIVHVRNHRL